MEYAMKYFLKNYLAMKNLGLWSPGLRNFFCKIYKTLQPPRAYLMCTPLYSYVYKILQYKISFKFSTRFFVYNLRTHI